MNTPAFQPTAPNVPTGQKSSAQNLRAGISPSAAPYESPPRRELLRIENLEVGFRTERGLAPAVAGVSLRVDAGEVVGLVGESGCGKSVTAMSVLRLVPSPPAQLVGGRILWRGEDLLAMSVDRLRAIRGREIAMVFQDPMTALSPLCRIGDQLAETALVHGGVSRREALALAKDWLGRVGLPDPARRMRDYPHQLSGGMQQRVMIASALMLDPALVIADEPTTALDAALQAQVLDLMTHVKRADTAVLLITHDMGVVRHAATRVAVMYAGQIVEEAPAAEFFAAPRHPYARALLEARPSRTRRERRLYAIPGSVPSPFDLPPGCRFAPRCRCAVPACSAAAPALLPCGEGRLCRCPRAGA